MNENAKMNQVEVSPDPSRRKFLNTAALAGLAGAGLSVGLSACNKESAPAPAAGTAPAAAPKAVASGSDLKLHMAPGELDTYYGVWSGGHSGECRILGLPSGREIKRIPTFNIDCMSGWGITNESKKVIGTRANGELKYKTGDTHHIHGSYVDGTYDGKYYWVND